VIDLPEARANSANKFFDGLAAGKPIFVNHGGWMHDLVLQHQCGIAAWGRPLDQVARELDCRLNDSEWLQRAGRSARKLAECCFDRDLLASQLERVLVATLNGMPDMAESIAPGVY
jgi:glycosyltransferase involved in cell wall biosynthesis